MNERIQELLHQCSVPDDQAENYSKSKGLVIPDQKLDVAKFAELIVRECANVIAPMGDWCGGHGEPSMPSTRDCAKRLKEHFGVEE
jgi:hypothetical protein